MRSERLRARRSAQPRQQRSKSCGRAKTRRTRRSSRSWRSAAARSTPRTTSAATRRIGDCQLPSPYHAPGASATQPFSPPHRRRSPLSNSRRNRRRRRSDCRSRPTPRMPKRKGAVEGGRGAGGSGPGAAGEPMDMS
eukprot:6285880-Prymnesium_polylepis.3